MKLGAAIAATLLAAGSARAARVPVAVLWLDGPHDTEAQVDRALAASTVVRPPDDPESRALLVEGGAAAQVTARLATARARFGEQRCAEADAILAEAEGAALTELSVADGLAALAAIEPLRLACADLARDDAAAARAARLFVLSGATPGREIAAALERHPIPPSLGAPPVRVESEPPGATVYVDLRPVGVTPIELPADRRADALVDLEMAGYRRVHRVAAAAGTLAVALARDDRLGTLVDRVRAAHGDAPEADVAAVGRRAEVARVVVARLDPKGAPIVQARVLDVATAKWVRPAIAVPAADAPARLSAYASLAAEPAAAPPPKKGIFALDTSKPAWKRWYTWVAGGALLAVVVGFVVAYHVGSDQVTIDVTH